ncbi:MAG TPA: hypothetical protein VMQ78_00255 [Candidatus Limnocylindria bacterium]|nr:hypothetical protein [Candidatus Limnocylindria bacterium]
MAGAIRPVVLLMLLASVLFIVDGILDGVYPGGPAWFTGKYQNLGEISYIFAILNTLVAYLVARGSERSLMARMGLSAFFLIERPLTAFVLGPKELPAIIVHLATALVELAILVSAVRVWRLGHSVGDAEMTSLFGLQSSSPMPVPAGDQDEAAPSAASPGLPRRTAWVLGGITIALAAVLVADGVVSGFVPGGREWSLSGEGSGWLVYLFAIVALTVAARAVHGGTLALRLLLATALLFVIERAFSPFVLRVVDPIALVLHELAAFVALALALACAGAIRAQRTRPDDDDVASLEAA